MFVFVFRWRTCWLAFWKPAVECGRCHQCCRKWSAPCLSSGSRPVDPVWTLFSGRHQGRRRIYPLSSNGQIGPRWCTWTLAQGLSLHERPRGNPRDKDQRRPQTCTRALTGRNKNLSLPSFVTSSARCASARCFSSGQPSPWPCSRCRSPGTCCSRANRGRDLSGCSRLQGPILPWKLKLVFSLDLRFNEHSALIWKTCQEMTQTDGFSHPEQSLSPKVDFLVLSYP